MPQGNGSGRANGLPIQGATPFPAGQARYHIIRAKPGADAIGVCLNSSIYGEDVHYVDGRSRPCRRKERACMWCGGGNRLRWYGYMPALLPNAGRIGIVEITYEAVKQARGFVSLCDLRGMFIRVQRLGTSKRGRCTVAFEDYKGKAKLPEEVDTRAALDAIWSELLDGQMLFFPIGEVAT